MTSTLFAERFALVPVEASGSEPASVYDERLGYSVTCDGQPYVELAVVGSTVTVTRADLEPDDDDREWVRAFGSIDTVTKAAKDADRWPL